MNMVVLYSWQGKYRSYWTNATSSCMRFHTLLLTNLLVLGFGWRNQGSQKTPSLENPPHRSMLKLFSPPHLYDSTAPLSLASKFCLLNWTESRALTKSFWKHHLNQMYLFILWGIFNLAEYQVSYRSYFFAARTITGFTICFILILGQQFKTHKKSVRITIRGIGDGKVTWLGDIRVLGGARPWSWGRAGVLSQSHHKIVKMILGSQHNTRFHSSARTLIQRHN